MALPTEANVTGMYSLFNWVSDVSEGSFFPIMIFGIFVILFMLLRGGTTHGKAFAGSAFICMILSILATALGWMSSSYMYAQILLVAIGGVWAYLEDKID